MAISTIKLFFTRIGGRDFPFAYNWYQPFGFNATFDQENQEYINYGNPIYKHSLLDVMNNFDDPKMFTTDDILKGYKSISDSIIAETGGNEGVKNIIITSTFWQKVINLLEIIYEDQTTFKADPVGTSGDGTPYTNRGDELLRSGDPLYENVAKIYVKGTLVETNPSSAPQLRDRIRSCTFTVSRTIDGGLTTEEKNEDKDTVNDSVIVTAYFNPDTFIEVGANNNCAVYSYEDLKSPSNEIDDVNIDINGNDEITRTEFDAGIIKRMTEILKDGKYKRYVRFCTDTTFYINKGTFQVVDGVPKLLDDDGNEITTENAKDFGYNKPFYIFTSLDETQDLSQEAIIQYIREYVNNNIFPDASGEDLVERNLRFPNLFTDAVVTVYPMYKNKTTTGAFKNPLDGTTLANFKTEINTLLVGDEYEIFYVGKGISGMSLNRFSKLPLFAIENDRTNTSKAPISTRYPTYRPVYSSTDNTEDIAESTIVFHDLCVLALNILAGNLNIKEVLADPKFNNIDIGGTKYPFVNSSIQLAEEDAGYDDTTGSIIYHNVRFTINNVTYKFVELV